MPPRPTNVRAWPPESSARASTSRKMSAAAIPAALRPCAWVAPTATAAAFFATPASSSPTGSSDTSHTTPERWNTSATRWASGSECEAHTSPAPGLHHLARVRGAADAGGALGAEGALQRHRRRHPVRAAPAPSPGRPPRRVSVTPRRPIWSSASPIPFDGTARNTRSGRSNWSPSRPERAHLQPLRQRDPGQVVRVLARGGQQLGLLGGAAQQRGAHARAIEQQRHGGAEGAGADHGGAAGVLARVAEARADGRGPYKFRGRPG